MITVPTTHINSAVAEALDATGREWRTEWVGGSDTAYYCLLRDLWAAGETFTLVEHDIVVTGEALDSLDECDSDWCACPYPYVNGWVFAGLGCTRFDAAIVRRHPDLMGVVADMSDDTHPPRHWCRLDAWISNELTRRGERRCETHPQVGHRMTNPRASAHGCFTE